MKLRARLATTTLAVALPPLLALLWWDGRARHDAAEAVMEEILLDHLARPGAQQACERDPYEFGHSGPQGGRGHGSPPPDGGPRPPGDGSPGGPSGPPDGSQDGALAGASKGAQNPGSGLGDGLPDGVPAEAPGAPDDGLGPRGGPAGPPDDGPGPGPLGGPDRPPGGGGHGGGPGGHGVRAKPPELWAYAPDGKASSMGAPILPDLARTLVHDHARVPSAWYASEVWVVAATGWDGPCAYILADGSTVPGFLGAVLPETRVWLTPVTLLFGVVLLAAGPIVTRILRLTDAVRAAAASGYAERVRLDGDDELAELAGAFDEAGQALRARMEENARREAALRVFLANTTHDVMIPLTVLQGHLDALRERPDPATVVSAMVEAHYIGSLLTNLSAAARLDAAEPALQRRPILLAELVERVAARHRPIAGPQGVTLEVALPEDALWINADVTLIEQAVSNIVFNAVRYNREGGHVAVVLEAGGPGFVLRVIDDGPGIDDADLVRLLQRGVRGDDARTRAPGGQGIGMDIARRAVDLHDLRMALRRSEYGGLEVEISGPVVPAL